MPDLPVVILTLLADATIFIFVGYYFFRMRQKEMEIDKREGKFDRDYHEIVDSALAKERKILEDATATADQIIAKAKEINQTVTTDIAKALDSMSSETQKEALITSRKFGEEYQKILSGLSRQSTNDFEAVFKEMKTGMLTQIEEFQKSTVPILKKEVEEYKKLKMEEVDKKAVAMAQKAAEEIFNKSLPLEDQQNLVIAALEKAKKEGLFE